MQTCSTWYLALDYFLAERCGSLTEHLSTPQTNSSYASQTHCYYIQYLSNQFVYWTGYYSFVKNKNPHRLTVVIISGSRQQKLKRKPNHITTLSTPQMYCTCWAHVLQQCLTCILDLTTSVGNMAVQKQQPAIPPANVSRHGPIHCKQIWIETTNTKVCWKWWDGQVKSENQAITPNQL